MKEVNGTLLSINISSGGIPKLPQNKVELLPRGLAGDGRNHDKHDRPWRSLSIIDDSLLKEIKNQGYDVYPGSMGENLTLSGIDSRELIPGDQLSFSGGAVIEVTETRIPCYVLDSISPSLKDDVWGRCGVMAKVVTPGFLSAGEGVEVGANSFDGKPFKTELPAVILAGGKSSRMGARKEGQRLPSGQTMIERTIQLLSAHTGHLFVVGECAGDPAVETKGVRRLDDIMEGGGPLAGIVTAMKVIDREAFLIMPCDQPLVSSYLISLLISRYRGNGVFFRSEDGKKLDPFPGIFPRHWLLKFEGHLHQGELKLTEATRSAKPDWITIPNRFVEELISINTPEQLADLPHRV